MEYERFANTILYTFISTVNTIVSTQECYFLKYFKIKPFIFSNITNLASLYYKSYWNVQVQVQGRTSAFATAISAGREQVIVKKQNNAICGARFSQIILSL